MLIECGGSHFNMGFEQGESLQSSIKEAFDNLFDFEPIKKIIPFYMNKSFVAETAGMIAYNFLMKKTEEFDMDTYQRLKGISAGSGLNLNLFLFAQFFESILATPFMTMAGCTGAIIDSQRTNIRRSLMIKNYDLFSFLPMTTCIRKSSPRARLKSMELILTPMAGSHIGLNEAGLGVSYNYGMEKSHYRRNLPPTLICQYILENFSRTKQAVEFISKMGTSNGAIFFLADESGSARTVEALGKHIGVRTMKDGIITATNMFLHPEMMKFNYKDTDRYDRNLSPKQYHRMLINTTHHMRYQRISNLLGRHYLFRFSVNNLKKILKDHNGEAEGNDNTICRHDEVMSTLASIIMDVKERKMEIAIGEPCRNSYKTYRL